jgi:hypothetical protein
MHTRNKTAFFALLVAVVFLIPVNAYAFSYQTNNYDSAVWKFVSISGSTGYCQVWGEKSSIGGAYIVISMYTSIVPSSDGNIKIGVTWDLSATAGAYTLGSCTFKVYYFCFDNTGDTVSLFWALGGFTPVSQDSVGGGFFAWNYEFWEYSQSSSTKYNWPLAVSGGHTYYIGAQLYVMLSNTAKFGTAVPTPGLWDVDGISWAYQ